MAETTLQEAMRSGDAVQENVTDTKSIKENPALLMDWVRFMNINDLGRTAYLVMEAINSERNGQHEKADLLNRMAIRQGIWSTAGSSQSEKSGVYNVSKLSDTMKEAGLEPEKFEPLLKQLHDSGQIQLHSGGVTYHADEDASRFETFTLNGKSILDFYTKKQDFMKALEGTRGQAFSSDRDEEKFAEWSLPNVTEKTIRDLNLLKYDGEILVYLRFRVDNEYYKGKILHVDEEQGYCVQQGGKRSVFAHQLHLLDGVPKVGDVVKITYASNGEKAKVAVQEEKLNRGLHR